MKSQYFVIAFLTAVSVGLPCTSLYLHRNDSPEAPKVAAEKKENKIRQECSAARQKRDQLYRDGVAHPDRQVDVRAACEPDEVAAEATATWVMIVLVLMAVFFLFPMLMFGMAPG